MKLLFSLIVVIFICKPLFSGDFETMYKVKTKGLTIGSLTWGLKISGGSYSSYLSLSNTGILSKLYKFNGKYRSDGKIVNGFFFSEKYNQFWKTKKKEKVVKIFYKNQKIERIELLPIEKELPRVDYKKLKGYNDPLASFLNIIFTTQPAYTIDGRRAYVLSPTQKEGVIQILIKKYVNIWADHKRNDLEYMEVFLEKDQDLPSKINIMFKGSVFSLIKN